MRSFAALSIVLLTTSSSASSVINIPLTKLQRTGTYLKGSPDADRARAAFLKLRTASGPTTVPATNLAYVQYTTSVGIGNPPTYYNLVVDTGSSNTFCGTGTPYVQTSTSIPTGEAVNVTYGSGYFSGLEYLDQVTLAANLVITNQSIGDALSYADFQGVDGIVGVGPVDLTLGTLSPDTNAAIPTVMNNLVSQGLIENQVLGVYFAPAVSYSDTNGALTYGGIDSGLYEGELTYVPVTMTYPAAYYWGINVTSSAYGTHTVIPTSTAGIVDTGTTQVLLADDFFAVYLKAIPGAKLDSNTGLIEIPPSSISSMQSLNFTIADRVFSMDVAAQLIPTDQNTAWGGVSGKQYGVVANLGSNSGEGLDFIIGQKFMERYYAVFDTDANRVGFAQTNNTFTTYQG
ncbi:acid protease [Boletus edulis BED1]|uniref:Acid protease n=1 Tax=Boletus edulis BED1 TaxID=1328754 RepID=A0AAD4GJW8_BOLED|nr:acid protease [Boletus edulis BED1]